MPRQTRRADFYALLLSIAVLAMLLVSVLVAAAGPVAASGMVAIDADHDLAEQGAINDFQDGDAVSTEFDSVMMSVTIAQDPEQVGLSSWKHPDIANHYLQISYQETIDRTVRFYIPSEYWSPYPKEDLQALDSDATITLRPTRDGRYTAVTIRVTEPMNSTFEISREAAALYGARETGKEFINNSTGVHIPSLAAKSQWEYLKAGTLSGNNTTVAINTGGEKLLVQYDVGENISSEHWIPVHECDGGDAPVCRFSRGGEPDTVFVLAKETPAPPVRYKLGGSAVDQILGSLRELTQFDERLSDFLGGFRDLIPW